MKKTNLILLLLLISLSAFSQYSISGKIVDEQNEPLPFANILLYKIEDTKDPKGQVSDDEGIFVFAKVTEGKYKMVVSMLGFATEKIKEFTLEANKTLTITLKEESQSLDEVVVKNKRPVIKQTAEKLIVDLENSEMVNTSLQDVMQKVPGVLVTNNGISIAGNSGVQILINGKTTAYMDVETLLRDFPADNIAQIEVVEQPGAEYDAAGSAAIINIILKKNVRLGTNGSLSSWVGEDEGVEFGSGLSLSSYKNKLNWQISASHSQPTWREDLFLVRTVADIIYDQTTIEPFDPVNNRLSASLDYYINEKHTIGLGARWNSRDSERIVDNITNIIKPNGTEVLLTNNQFDRERIAVNINPYYEFKTEKDKLTVDFNFVDFTNNSTNTLFDTPQSQEAFIDRRYIQNGTYQIKTYSVDYTKTFSDNLTFKAGSRFADVATNNDLDALIDENGSFQLIDDESSRFLVDETIFALYSKITAKKGKWSFSGGLRYEDSNTKGTSLFMNNGKDSSAVVERPIEKIFPSASISRKLTKALGATLSYSYRIQRPSYNSLNSFQQFLDPFSANQGNQNLRPSFTNKYQFNLTYEGQPFFTIAHNTTEDAIFQLVRQNDKTAQIRQQEVNVEENRNWNFRLFAPVNFTKGLDGFTGIIVANTDFKSETYNLDLNKWNLIWFIQASYELPLDIDFELYGNYGTGALEGPIEVDWLAELGFSFSKKFLKDERLKVNLGFNKMLNRGFVGQINIVDENNANRNSFANVESNGSRQSVQLRAVYTFGDKFGKKKSRKVSRDEENRIQDTN